MAPSRFSMYSPGPDPDDRPPGEPLYGAGREQDPGHLASIRDGSVLGQLRLMMLVLLAAPLLILVITPLLVHGDPPGAVVAWLCLPLAVAAAVAAIAGSRTPRPMRPGGAPARAAADALAHFRQALMVRYALAEGVILIGLVLAIAFGSELLYVAGLVLGYPVLLWLVLLTTGRVDAVRRRLEAGGASSHLWAALLGSARGPGGAGHIVPEDGDARRPEDDQGPGDAQEPEDTQGPGSVWKS